MRKVLLPFILAFSGCASFGPAPAAVEVVSQRIAPEDAMCRIYFAHVQMDGRMSDLSGRACRLANGSWRVAEGPPEDPRRVETVYVPDTHAIFNTWSSNPPIGISLGRPVVFWTPPDMREGGDIYRSR